MIEPLSSIAARRGGHMLLAGGLLLALLAPAAALADVRLGIAGPFSGAMSAWGQQMRRGADAAVRAINAEGGLDGERVVLVFADDGGDPRRGVETARALVDQQTVAVIGHFGSEVSIPASFIYADAGIIQIVPAATSDELTEQGFELLFRTSGRDDQQGAVAGAWLAGTYRGQKVAIIHDRTAYGRALAEAAKATMNAAGLEEAVFDTIAAGSEDFTDLVDQLKAAGVDAVYFGGLAEDGGRLLAALRRAGVIAQFVGGDALAEWSFWTAAGPLAVGTVVTTDRALDQTPRVRRLRQSLASDDTTPAELLTALYSYTAVEVWAQAVRAAGTTDPYRVADAMKHAGTVDTITGPLAFDLRGDRFPPVYVLYRWRDDGWLGQLPAPR
jgi:branched-chain amino acid transport system substrate-binding protein